jgi:hypothetical protein
MSPVLVNILGYSFLALVAAFVVTVTVGEFRDWRKRR